MELDDYRSDSPLTICFNWLPGWLTTFTFNVGVKVLSGIEHWRVLILFLTFIIGHVVFLKESSLMCYLLFLKDHWQAESPIYSEFLDVVVINIDMESWGGEV
uniref:Uncharacterized protein n=1 Tax=Glossina pallidipes TaxID=7398 RepID=A0A1A9ZSE3_GLOPL